MAWLGLQLVLGSGHSATEFRHIAPANDDSSREQELFDRCVQRELVEDMTDDTKH